MTFPLVGYSTIAGAEPLAWQGDLAGDGAGLLLAQFQKPNIEALLRALSAASQDVENAAWAVLTERWLTTGTHARLDRIGELLDLPRAGWDDDTYRGLLLAQVLVLRSSSTWPDLFDVLRALGLTLSLVTHTEHYPAALLVVLSEVPSIAGEYVFRLLDASRPAGVRLVLEVPMSALADAFTFSDDDAAPADTARGWGDDAGATGGVLADDYASSEGA